MITQQKESAIEIVLSQLQSGKMDKSDALALILALTSDDERKTIVKESLNDIKHEKNN